MSARMLSLHHMLKAVILFGFALYIAQLVKSDNILYYIAPRMVDYVKWSALALYVIAAYQAYLGIRSFRGKSAAECDCDHDHTPSRSIVKNVLIYGTFIAPLLLGFVLPDASMGSSLAAKKGMNLSSSSTVKSSGSAPRTEAEAAPPASSGQAGGTSASAWSDEKLNELFPYDKFTEHYAKYARELYKKDVIAVPENMYIETLTTMDLYMDQFIGKKLELTGFVYRQEPMTDKQFVVGRFAIQCCSADAAPFGVLTDYANAKSFADDTWVKATGTLQKTHFNDMDIMLLKIEKIEKIEAPKTQYTYPNPDFGA
ncbi:TIGR03943 family putative permease subunit [Paenibacillus hamazuiensis]|uniref:TIGR03943 family putative permease subunit n=1 Tax=Paenibacillus hamazuiensis TaxID=2936508 RepID=UPI00200D4229|nr:TIGR03943 family protein [Paenibacillus hamazuiensis]